MYHSFIDDEGHEFGRFECFYLTKKEIMAVGPDSCWYNEGQPMPPGWYWWACFPGCLPDGDPSGPFATEAEAIEDAQYD
jgi:hypothetical protein